MKTSWRRLWSSSSEDVFKTSWRHLDQDEYIRLTHTSSEEVFIKINIFVLVIRLQDVFKTFSIRLQDVFKTSSRRLQDVFKTSSRHLQDIFKMFWKRLQDVFKTFQDVFNTYYQVKLFLVTQFQYVIERYSKRFWDVLLRRLSTGGLPRSHFWEIYGQCTKFPRVIKISEVLIFHFTTTFSGYTLQRRI